VKVNPRKRTPSLDRRVAEIVRRDRYSREKSTHQIAADLREEGRDVTHQTV
jgi:hypothetical protein